METVVVDFDFSSQSERALALALRGKPFGADTMVDVCHVVDEAVYRRARGRGALPSDNAIICDVEETVERQRLLLGNVRQVPHQVTLVHGPTSKALSEYISTHSARGVMLGGQGFGGLAEHLLGRPAQRVLRQSNAPVYIVKETRQSRDVRPILCAIDCGPGAALALRQAWELAEREERALELVMVVVYSVVPYSEATGFAAPYETDQAKEELAAFERATLGAPVARARHVVVGAPAPAITRLVEERDAGIVVLGSHGHGPTAHLLLGSIGESVALRSPVDVLIAR